MKLTAAIVEQHAIVLAGRQRCGSHEDVVGAQALGEAIGGIGREEVDLPASDPQHRDAVPLEAGGNRVADESAGPHDNQAGG
jgi:hypothetical protein